MSCSYKKFSATRRPGRAVSGVREKLRHSREMESRVATVPEGTTGTRCVERAGLMQPLPQGVHVKLKLCDQLNKTIADVGAERVDE